MPLDLRWTGRVVLGERLSRGLRLQRPLRQRLRPRAGDTAGRVLHGPSDQSGLPRGAVLRLLDVDVPRSAAAGIRVRPFLFSGVSRPDLRGGCLRGGAGRGRAVYVELEVRVLAVVLGERDLRSADVLQDRIGTGVGWGPRARQLRRARRHRRAHLGRLSLALCAALLLRLRLRRRVVVPDAVAVPGWTSPDRGAHDPG